jgi:hypothetical protein
VPSLLTVRRPADHVDDDPTRHGPAAVLTILDARNDTFGTAGAGGKTTCGAGGDTTCSS